MRRRRSSNSAPGTRLGRRLHTADRRRRRPHHRRDPLPHLARPRSPSQIASARARPGRPDDELPTNRRGIRTRASTPSKAASRPWPQTIQSSARKPSTPSKCSTSGSKFSPRTRSCPSRSNTTQKPGCNCEAQDTEPVLSCVAPRHIYSRSLLERASSWPGRPARLTVQVQDLGQQLCWQLYLDNPGDTLGTGEFVHATAAALDGGCQPQISSPTLTTRKRPSHSRSHSSSTKGPITMDRIRIQPESGNRDHGIFEPDIGKNEYHPIRVRLCVPACSAWLRDQRYQPN